VRPKGAHPVFWRTFLQPPPPPWVLSSIADLADNFKGKLPTSLSSSPSADAQPYLLVEGFERGQWTYTTDTDLPQVSEADTVLVADGSRSGLALRGRAGALGSTLLCFRAKEGVDPDFLFYLLQSFYAFTNTATIGGAVPHLDLRLLNGLKLYVPPTKKKQSAIGYRLRAIDAVLIAAETELRQARRLKTALMQQLFTRGVPGWHQRFQRTRWFEAPEAWIPKTLRQVAEVEAGFTMGRDLSGNETVNVSYLTVVNVQEGGFDLKDVSSILVKKSELNGLLLTRGDVLMTEGGDRDKLGRGGIWRGEIEPCVYQNHIFRVRFKSDAYKPELFHHLLQTWHAKNYFFAHAKQTSNLCTINSRELKRLPLFEPTPDEQKEMIALLDAADAEINSMKDEMAALARLKQSLLQSLLTGRVRVAP
jgi:type I restriction enzyme S subunit